MFAGRFLHVGVDAWRGSPTQGQCVTEELSAANGPKPYVAKVLLHGFVTLVDDTEVQYKCFDTYAPYCDGQCGWTVWASTGQCRSCSVVQGCGSGGFCGFCHSYRLARGFIGFAVVRLAVSRWHDYGAPASTVPAACAVERLFLGTG